MLFSSWFVAFSQGCFRISWRPLLVGLAVAGFQIYLHPQNGMLADLHSAEVALEDGRSTLEESKLIFARRFFEQCAKNEARNSRCYYDLGRVDSYLSQVAERHNHKQDAMRLLDSAIENTQRSIDLFDGSADAHALLADLYGRKIGYGGMFTGMHLGPKAEAETRRALQLDPNDPRIYVVLGRRQLYSPKIFGGDVDKAIESFRKSTTLDSHFDEGFVWLAIAYQKKGDIGSAKAALDEVLRLNSQNVIARELRSSIK